MSNKKIKIEMTESELSAIVCLMDDISAMCGGTEQDTTDNWKKQIKLIDKMLNRNGYKRKYN